MAKNLTGTIKGNQNTTLLLNQLKNSIKQYPTLNKKQEREMIEKYRNDRETLNQLLVMHNIRIVFNMAQKYMSKTDDFDGMVQDGLQGLAEAASKFNLDMGIKFITYAHIWVRKMILSRFYARNIEVENNSLSLSSPTLTSSKSNNGNELEFEDRVNEYIDPSYTALKTVDDELSANEKIEICQKLMKRLDVDTSLSATDKSVFVDIFYNGEKTRDIADKYDISTVEVNDIKRKILCKFRNILMNDYSIVSSQEV